MAGLDERWRAGLTALVAVGIPVAAGVAAGMRGDGDGHIFQAGAVLGACVATVMATRRGLWWLVPAQPMIVVPSAVLGMLLAEPAGTSRTKMGTDTVSALHHAFVITLVALGAVLVVAGLKAVAGRGGEPKPAGAQRG
ncbi:hypothetical protein ABIA35_006813 [Catenulispora sp. MAP12-49]|jgi:hypothetical protein|uniref:DUF6542 domain-containing protein n=1 Tax=unclassified Catenulispora TaxID=414885 RepID=UPI003515FF94